MHRPAARGIIVPMSDQKLRELERRWKESESVEDEAVYLRERVRVGGLTQDRLELAASCGHPAARRAMCLPEHGALAPAIESLARGLGTQGLIAAATDAVADIRDAVESGGAVERLLVAARDWLECPCDEHGAACIQAAAFDHQGMHPAVGCYSGLLWWTSERTRGSMPATMQNQHFLHLQSLCEHLASISGRGHWEQWRSMTASLGAKLLANPMAQDPR